MSAVATPPPSRTRVHVPKWKVTKRQVVIVILVFIGIAIVQYTYEALNAAPSSGHWPYFWSFDSHDGVGHVLQQPYDIAADPAPAGDAAAAATHTFVLKSWVDTAMPFVPLLAIPYLSFLLLAPIVGPLLSLSVSFKRFLTEAFALILSQLVLDVGYILFQTEVLRDTAAQNVVAEGGFGATLVNLVWGKDAPFNGYPSGHVTWTTITIIALFRLRKVYPKTAWIIMAWMCLIFPATVMLRQHYLMDVYAGLFVGFACYWACMFIIERPKLVPRGESALGVVDVTT